MRSEAMPSKMLMIASASLRAALRIASSCVFCGAGFAITRDYLEARSRGHDHRPEGPDCETESLSEGDLIPMLDDLSVAKPKEVRILHADRLSRRRHSEEFAAALDFGVDSRL